MYRSGYKFKYDSHDADSELNERTGQIAEIIRSLKEPEECDHEVGPMYKVRFEDGFETDIFEDEIAEHVSEEYLQSQQELFDELNEKARNSIIDAIVDYLADPNTPYSELEDVTGYRICLSEDDDTIFDAFDIDSEKYKLEEGEYDWNKIAEDHHILFSWKVDSFAEAAEELLRNDPIRYSVDHLLYYVKGMSVDLMDVEIPYKIIIYNLGIDDKKVGDYNLDGTELRVEDVDREMLDPLDVAVYEIAYNKEDLIEKWKELFEKYEGCWYAVRDAENVIVGGAMDPNDLDDLEELVSFITEYEICHTVKGMFYIDDDTSEIIKDKGGCIEDIIETSDFGDLENFEYDVKGVGYAEIEGSYTTFVQSYTTSGAIARSQDALGKANFGELKDIVITDTDIVNSYPYEAPDKYERIAQNFIDNLKDGRAASCNLEINGHYITSEVVKDPDLKNVYELVLCSNDKIMGKIHDLCGVEDLAQALRDLDNKTAVISSAKGKRVNVNELFKEEKNHEQKSEKGE